MMRAPVSFVPERFARTTIQPSIGEITRLLKNLGLTVRSRTRCGITFRSPNLRCALGVSAAKADESKLTDRTAMMNGFIFHVWVSSHATTRSTWEKPTEPLRSADGDGVLAPTPRIRLIRVRMWEIDPIDLWT